MMLILKTILASKVLTFNAVMFICGLITLITKKTVGIDAQNYVITLLADPEIQGFILIVGNSVLRFFTTKSLAEKVEEKEAEGKLP